MSHRILTRHAPATDRGTDWRDNGLCTTHPEPDLWYPDGNSGRYFLQTEEAKEICRHCPVMEACRQWSLERREAHGVWGGLSPRERQAILRRRGHGTGRPRKARAA